MYMGAAPALQPWQTNAYAVDMFSNAFDNMINGSEGSKGKQQQSMNQQNAQVNNEYMRKIMSDPALMQMSLTGRAPIPGIGF